MPYQGYDKLNVLVLDDFEGFRSTLSSMLETFGISRVDTASNAEDALKACKTRYYDVILSDYNLGHGRTGLQLLEELRYREIIKQTQAFILISAENSKQIVLAATDVEPDAYLSKPITAKALQHRLDRILLQRRELRELFQALDKREIPAAIAVCRQHIEARGHQSSLCQKHLGQLLLQMGELDQAELVYQSVLEVRPLEWAKLGMAQIKCLRGDLNTAERWYRELITANPLCLRAYDGLAEVYKELQDDENLQKVLQDAVAVSPLALLRQEQLAEIATSNCDFATSARAYRRVVRLADQSVYKSPEQNLAFARATLRLEEQDSKAAVELGRDALKKLVDLEADILDEDLQLQAQLLQTQLYLQQKDSSRAELSFEACQEMIDQATDSLSFEVEVEMVKTLRAISKEAEAKEKLDSLCSKYEDDEEKLEVLDSLLEEPKSAKNRKLVSRINKEGIRHYQAKNFVQAVESFSYAKRLFPNHVGVQLNLVQVLLAEMEEFGCKQETLQTIEESLARVTHQIQATNTQYNRFVQLREMHKAMVRQLQ
ncbi:response regulator [Halioxenophilus sp. WMMB6]|uniref:response regulator n=1 Tax=Halioxenophilus sp. WMMB6 TaxID=3073815 RepID=UPI00295ED487|nr:response regulator [Halioxenophilus sp. WMMB6]